MAREREVIDGLRKNIKGVSEKIVSVGENTGNLDKNIRNFDRDIWRFVQNTGQELRVGISFERDFLKIIHSLKNLKQWELKTKTDQLRITIVRKRNFMPD